MSKGPNPSHTRWRLLPDGSLIHRHRTLLTFLSVGVVNTAIYYVVYRLFLLGTPYMVAHLCGWGVGIVASFFLNCRFTFHVRPTWKRFVTYPVTTAANFVISTVASYVLVSIVGISDRIGTLIAAVLAIPITFVVTRYVLRPGAPEQQTQP